MGFEFSETIEVNTCKYFCTLLYLTYCNTTYNMHTKEITVAHLVVDVVRKNARIVQVGRIQMLDLKTSKSNSEVSKSNI